MRMSSRGLRPSPSMIVAFVALLVALGGSSYAVVRLPAHSVGTKQLKAKAVARVNIKNNAVSGAKVADNSLAGADIVESSLAKVPSAATADRASSSDHAGSAGGLDAVTYRTGAGVVPAAPAPGETSFGVASAFCDAGQHVTGGGVKLDDTILTAIVDTYPDFGGTTWTAHVDNSDDIAPHGFTVYAICIPSAAG